MITELLHTGFLRSAALVPDRSALHVDGRIVSYGDLSTAAWSLAATLQRNLPDGAPPLTAVLADRSRAGFTGILGSLLAGHGYVPLNPTFPIARTKRMFEQSGCRSIVVDARSASQLDELLDGIGCAVLIVLPDWEAVDALSARWPTHRVVGARDLSSCAEWEEQPVTADAIAYLMFTSGTTGSPKGIGVTHRNVTHFVRTTAERYEITSDDRFSQMFDTTFDLSIFDLFVAWDRGACVYCPSRATLLNPARFVQEHSLTVWFSVPTVALLMQRLGALKPASFPSLRWSLFCGEPLPVQLAESWSTAAPDSTIENLYGPTELTVACTAYRYDARRPADSAKGGLVPIGSPNHGMSARIVDDTLNEVSLGEVGELLMAGPQCVPGYWRDPVETSRAFVRLPNSDQVFYRTGDRVSRSAEEGPLHFVGRNDHQIKISGYRVELGEIESVLRQEPGVVEAIALAWPRSQNGAAGVAAFLTGQDIDVSAVRARARGKLQSYAVPQTILVLPALPHNANGKVDRRALLGLLGD